MQADTFPTCIELGELTAFVANTMFDKAFSANERLVSPDELSAGNVLGCGMELSMQGEPTWLLRAYWSKGRAPALLDGEAREDRQAAQKLDQSAMGELLNIVAGQLKIRYNLPHTLGLPHPFTPASERLATEGKPIAGTWLVAEGGLGGLFVEVLEAGHK